MNQIFYRKLPKIGQKMATLFWVRSIFVLTNTATVDDYIEKYWGSLGEKEQRSLRRFLFHKLNGVEVRSSIWVEKLNLQHQALSHILEHPIWRILSASSLNELEKLELQSRLVLPKRSMLRIKKELGINFFNSKLRESTVLNISKDLSLDSLALLCLLCRQNHTYELEQAIKEMYISLIISTPLQYIWKSSYTGLFNFIHPNINVNAFADSLRLNINLLASLLATPSDQYLSTIQKKLSLLDEPEKLAVR